MMAISQAERISIRPMELDDLEQVHTIDTLSFAMPWSLRTYRSELTGQSFSLMWVAEVEEPQGDRRVVGMVVIWMVVDQTHIATLAVHPDHRRQGIASRLLETALDGAVRKKAQAATLEVRVSNRAAQALYKKFGFVKVGRRRAYYLDNGEDAVLMTIERLKDWSDWSDWLD